MAIWSKMNEWCFFYMFIFLLLAIFSKISALQVRSCAFETLLVAIFHLTPISMKSDKQKFFVWKSKPLKYLQYSKLKKFSQIKNVKIDRNGTQTCCTLNRLKIFHKLRLQWLFKVLGIMRNIWKLELALITLKFANALLKLNSCPL